MSGKYFHHNYKRKLKKFESLSYFVSRNTDVEVPASLGSEKLVNIYNR